MKIDACAPLRSAPQKLILKAMFDDDEKPKPASEFPRNLESLSIEDLRDYVAELTAELQRVETDITQKTASNQAAAAFFKS